MGAQTIHSDLIRGHIDTMILRVLLDGDSYGYEIIKNPAFSAAVSATS